MPNSQTALCRGCRRLFSLGICVNCQGFYYCPNCARSQLHTCPSCLRLLYRGDLCSQCRPREAATWHPAPVACGSGRCFGIELETSSCNGYRSLRGQTCFGAKHDSSISGMEFVSPVLCGDRGLTEVTTFCKNAKDLGFTVDGDCGYHLHIDMRETSTDQRKAIAYAYRLTYPFWASFVNSFRANDCRYCKAPSYRGDELLRDDFDYFCRCSDRYEFVNLAAYRTHKTFEIRGHQGTLNPVEILNWIEAHLRFVEAVENQTPDDLLMLNWKKLKKILGADLARYYGRKRAPVTFNLPQPSREWTSFTRQLAAVSINGEQIGWTQNINLTPANCRV